MFQNDLEAVRDRCFNVSCVSIVLKRKTKTYPTVISGAGRITISSDRFEITIHAKFRKPINEDALFSDTKAGDIIPDSEYYRMKATDYNGQEWHADNVLVRTHSYPN